MDTPLGIVYFMRHEPSNYSVCGRINCQKVAALVLTRKNVGSNHVIKLSTFKIQPIQNLVIPNQRTLITMLNDKIILIYSGLTNDAREGM